MAERDGTTTKANTVKVYDISRGRKRRPFEDEFGRTDPDLRRTVNRLGSTGSQFAGWISNRERKPVTGLRAKVLRLATAK